MAAKQTVDLEEEKDLKNTKIYINCSVCKRENQSSTILHAVNQTGEIVDDDENYFQWGEKSQLIICNGCESIFLRRRNWNSEEVDYGYDREGKTKAEYTVKETIYPTVQKDRELEKHFHLIPDDLLEIYEETSKALEANHKILTGVGIRAIIETVCKERSAAGDNLFQRINGLRDLGLLSTEGCKLLHKMRALGNDAAHSVKPHTKKQLLIAMEVVDNLLLNVYVLDHHSKTTFKDIVDPPRKPKAKA